ncbi:YlbF family regulator [Bacillus carboniphilus]|uniref:YlbF family regulator n=2 Tax=Bacillus carboniphilus TaxID=86663 RepID=A0ABY9K0B0_9BACI|nr:YlbF family regulator [Bacillus carboniphilus]WLR44267.1 YlbF family regulator [Bacillus carboniphilus]
MLLEETESIVQMILSSEVVKNYYEAFNSLYKDERAMELINKFTHYKGLYEEVQRFGKYHPDYKEISTQVRLVKRELDLHEKVYQFKVAENELQNLLDEISRIIGYSVSEQIKVPSGNPFFDSLSSCGGGCGSGGSCGCKAS